jgi:hypothetical protein
MVAERDMVAVRLTFSGTHAAKTSADRLPSPREAGFRFFEGIPIPYQRRSYDRLQRFSSRSGALT